MNLGGTVRLNKCGVLVGFFLVLLILYYMSSSVTQIENRTVNLRQLLLASVEIAERGGKEVIKARSDPNLKEMSKGKTNEGANIPVTSGDLMSHCVMTKGLADLFPQIQIISEEKGPTKCNTLPVEIGDRGIDGLQDLVNVEVLGDDVVVWVDPLDATQEYTENLLKYVTTMVCVAIQGKPVIGVIHKPFGDEPKTVWGWVNHGHSPLPSPAKKDEDIVVISRSHTGDAEKAVKAAMGDNVKIIKAGGSGYKVLEVVSGNASTYIHTTMVSKWDICAGDAILTEVGGRFTALDGDEIDYAPYPKPSKVKGIVATRDPDRHGELVKALRQATA